MHIPIAVDYGVRALVDLALHADTGLVRTSDIAQRNAIPELYLEQILSVLNKKGLTRSHRGPQGGHALALRSSEISLSMVMTALGETGVLVSCLDSREKCVLTPSCAQRDVWLTVGQAINSILDATTIADLANRTQAYQWERKRVSEALDEGRCLQQSVSSPEGVAIAP
ncbi:MAG: Rrf2 family transcriptional regulator [Chloroflexi bacterium]|nr:Rrf2 family transcriptional regulator [Chloroflexota bacterium]